MTAIIIKGRQALSSPAGGEPRLRDYPLLLTGLSGYWHLDEFTGNRLDKTANNNHLAPVNAPIGSKISGARIRNNASQKLRISSNASLATGDADFTVSAWIRLETKTNYRFFICKDNIFDNLREWNLAYVASEGTIVDRLSFTLSTSGGIIACPYSFLNPAVDTWYFLVAWHDSQSNSLNLQVDNKSIQTTTYTGTKSNATTADFTIGNSSDDLGLYHDGHLLNVGFWKRILSVQERTDLYNNGYWLKY